MSAAPAHNANPFFEIFDKGYTRLVSIIPPDAKLSPFSSISRRPQARGKAVGELGPHGFKGYDWHRRDGTPEDFDRWHASGAGVGIKMGQGLIAMDIDSLDPALSKLADEAALEILGQGARRVGRAPKVALLYAVHTDPSYTRIEFTSPVIDIRTGKPKRERVEMLCEGTQIVANGIHPDTLKAYHWPEGLPHRDTLTSVTQQQIDAYFDRLLEILPEAGRPTMSDGGDRAAVNQDTLIGELDYIQRVVDLIPNDTRDRKRMVEMGCAIKAALRDEPIEGFETYWSWASRRPGQFPKDHDLAAAEWRSFKPPFKLGASYLYNRASTATGEQMTPPDAFFQPLDEDQVEAEADVFATATPARAPITFVSFDEAAASAETDTALPLIKGLLDQGAMSVLYGESNVGKTFVSMDMAYAIARGLPWGGMAATKMVVVYVAGEGGRGARRRAAALSRRYGPCVDFHFILMPLDLLHPDADLQPLLQALAGLGVPVGFIVIDTLSRAMAGGDENSSVDMGAFVRHVDVIRAATGAHVMLVHHSGKDRAKGARGHSLLRAATDTEIEVEAGQISVQKQRDLDKSFATAFELAVVELGKDADGDPVTSCTVNLLEHKAEAAPGVATPSEREILDAFELCSDTASDLSADGFGVAEIEKACSGRMSLEQVRFHVRSLVAKNLLRKVGRGRWKLPNNSGGEAFFTPIETHNSVFD